MKLFQLNNNKKNCPLDLPKPRKRQINMYCYSVKKTSDGDYPKYSPLSSFWEATVQKMKQHNILKTVLNMQFPRMFTTPFQSSMAGSLPRSRWAGWESLFKTLHQERVQLNGRTWDCKTLCQVIGLSPSPGRWGMYFPLVFLHRGSRLWVSYVATRRGFLIS